VCLWLEKVGHGLYGRQHYCFPAQFVGKEWQLLNLTDISCAGQWVSLKRNGSFAPSSGREKLMHCCFV